VPDGHMTSSYSIQKQVQEPTAPSSPRAIAGTPSGVRAEQVEKEAQAAAGRKRALMYGAAALLALGVAAIVVVPIARRQSAAPKDEPRMVVEPTVRPAEADKPLTDDKADHPLVAAEGDVRVVSEPAGAQVYAGPKLVGTAPVTMHLRRGGGSQVTLVHPGYEDLTYTVQPGDAPSLTLRMLRKRKSTADSRPPTVKDSNKSPHKSKIDTFDDDKAPHIPKVQTLDD